MNPSTPSSAFGLLILLLAACQAPPPAAQRQDSSYASEADARCGSNYRVNEGDGAYLAGRSDDDDKYEDDKGQGSDDDRYSGSSADTCGDDVLRNGGDDDDRREEDDDRRDDDRQDDSGSDDREDDGFNDDESEYAYQADNRDSNNEDDFANLEANGGGGAVSDVDISGDTKFAAIREGDFLITNLNGADAAATFLVESDGKAKMETVQESKLSNAAWELEEDGDDQYLIRGKKKCLAPKGDGVKLGSCNDDARWHLFQLEDDSRLFIGLGETDDDQKCLRLKNSKPKLVDCNSRSGSSYVWFLVDPDDLKTSSDSEGDVDPDDEALDAEEEDDDDSGPLQIIDSIKGSIGGIF